MIIAFLEFIIAVNNIMIRGSQATHLIAVWN